MTFITWFKQFTYCLPLNTVYEDTLNTGILYFVFLHFSELCVANPEL